MLFITYWVYVTRNNYLMDILTYSTPYILGVRVGDLQNPTSLVVQHQLHMKQYPIANYPPVTTETS